jgi:hypothetical protein
MTNIQNAAARFVVDTPYAHVKRRRAQQIPESVIAYELQGMGLGDDEVRFFVPLHRSGEDEVLEDAVVELPPDDPAERCARHPQFAAKDACTRCGTFACPMCCSQYSAEIGPHCQQCEFRDEVRPHILKKARLLASNVLLTPSAVFVLLLGLAQMDESYSVLLTSIVRHIAGTIPWLMLALAQHYVSHPWPSALGSLLWGLLLLPGLWVAGELSSAWVTAVLFLPCVFMAVGALAVKSKRQALMNRIAYA